MFRNPADGKKPTRSSTSVSLLQRVQQDDSMAWQRLVELYGPLVYSWCRRAELSADDAADVVQEVFCTVARKIGEFRRDRPDGTFRGWLHSITRSRITDHHRRSTRQPNVLGGTLGQAILDATATAETDDCPISAEVHGLFHRALEFIQNEFCEQTWQAFWRTTVDAIPSSAVAEELQMSPGAVRQAKYRVLHRVRQELGEID